MPGPIKFSTSSNTYPSSSYKYNGVYMNYIGMITIDDTVSATVIRPPLVISAGKVWQPTPCCHSREDLFSVRGSAKIAFLQCLRFSCF